VGFKWFVTQTNDDNCKHDSGPSVSGSNGELLGQPREYQRFENGGAPAT